MRARDILLVLRTAGAHRGTQCWSWQATRPHRRMPAWAAALIVDWRPHAPTEVWPSAWLAGPRSASDSRTAAEVAARSRAQAHTIGTSTHRTQHAQVRKSTASHRLKAATDVCDGGVVTCAACARRRQVRGFVIPKRDFSSSAVTTAMLRQGGSRAVRFTRAPSHTRHLEHTVRARQSAPSTSGDVPYPRHALLAEERGALRRAERSQPLVDRGLHVDSACGDKHANMQAGTHAGRRSGG